MASPVGQLVAASAKRRARTKLMPAFCQWMIVVGLDGIGRAAARAPAARGAEGGASELGLRGGRAAHRLAVLEAVAPRGDEHAALEARAAHHRGVLPPLLPPHPFCPPLLAL